MTGKEMGFGKNFLIGAATAAYQVEGDSTNSDVWCMEHMRYGGYKELKGAAADHYHTYREDIRMMAEAGLNAYRFSIEWPRVEPEEGVFDEAEMAHYLDMVHACREYGLEPVVTLFHFSSPRWLITKGGWEVDSVVEDFAAYARYVCEHLQGEDLRYLVTINEANLGTLIAGYIAKAKAAESAGQLQIGMDLDAMAAEEAERRAECQEVFGVDEAAVFQSPRTTHGNELIMAAHRAAVDVVHELLPGTKAGLSLSIGDLQAAPGGEARRDHEWQEVFGQFVPTIRDDDFLGLQSYTRNVFGPGGEILPGPGAELTQMGYEYYPEGIAHVAATVSREVRGEILITENGIATADDDRRCDFIRTALAGVSGQIDRGVPIVGYLYWSLIDNWEWQSGYGMQFGLVELDRRTGAHIPKHSLAFLGSYTG